jgi:hypothetical protein
MHQDIPNSILTFTSGDNPPGSSYENRATEENLFGDRRVLDRPAPALVIGAASLALAKNWPGELEENCSAATPRVEDRRFSRIGQRSRPHCLAKSGRAGSKCGSYCVPIRVLGLERPRAFWRRASGGLRRSGRRVPGDHRMRRALCRYGRIGRNPIRTTLYGIVLAAHPHCRRQRLAICASKLTYRLKSLPARLKRAAAPSSQRAFCSNNRIIS